MPRENEFLTHILGKDKTLEGFDDLDKKLARLGSKVSKDIVRKANRTAIKVVQKRVQEKAKSMIGGNMGALIAKNIKIQVFPKQRKGSYGLRLGVKPRIPELEGKSTFRSGSGKMVKGKLFRKAGRRWYIPAALEYGHGNARPIPWFRVAWAISKKLSVRTLQKELKKGIEREAKRG